MTFSDEELMVMFSAGTSEAFDILYDRYRHRVYALALNSLHSPADAEDVTQEVFLRLARSTQSYKPQNKFRSWIFTITANRIRTLAARESQKTKARKQWQFFNEENCSTTTISPSQIVDAQTQLSLVMKSLSAEQRVMILLKEIEGMDIKTIAGTLALTPENVRVKLHRARKKLKETFHSGTEEPNR